MFNSNERTHTADQSICECRKKKLFEQLKRMYSDESNIECDTSFKCLFAHMQHDLSY
jgi:hypothetical protein